MDQKLPINEEIITFLKPALDHLIPVGYAKLEVGMIRNSWDEIKVSSVCYYDSMGKYLTGESISELESKMAAYDPIAIKRSRLAEIEAEAGQLKAELEAIPAPAEIKPTTVNLITSDELKEKLA